MSPRAEQGAQKLKAGNLEAAAEAFTAALSDSPTDKEALLGLAKIHLARGQTSEARPLLQRLAKLAPGHSETLSHLARMRAEAGDAKAVSALKLLAKQKTAGFAEFYNLGYVQLNRGQYEDAAQAFVQALKLVPRSGQAVTYLGMARERIGKLDEAMRCYKAGAFYAPNEHLPFLLGARLLVKTGKAAEAVAVMKRAVARAPGEASLRAELVRMCLYAVDLEEAHTQAIALKSAHPTDAEAAYLLGLVLLLRGDAKSAVAGFEDATRLAPKSWEAHLALSKALRLSGEEGRGVQALQQAYTLAPTEPGPANDLAVWHLGAPDGAARARAILEPVLKVHPDDSDVHLNLALALLKTDRAASERHARRARASTVPSVKEQADRLLKKLITPTLRLPIRA